MTINLIVCEELNLDEGGVRFEEDAGELVGRVKAVEEGVNIVILDEIAAPRTDEVDSTGENGVGFTPPHHIHHFALPLLVVLQLLR